MDIELGYEHDSLGIKPAWHGWLSEPCCACPRAAPKARARPFKAHIVSSWLVSPMNPAYLKNADARKKTSHVASKLNPFFGVHTTAHSHVGMGMEMEWRALGFKASESLAGGLHMV